MDLPDLLEPERIRLGCNIQSKKRALQTLAELLGDALRPDAADEPSAPSATDGTSDRAEGGLAPAGRGPTGRGSTGRGSTGRGPGERSKADRGKGERSKGDRGSRKNAPDTDADGAGVSDMDILDALISRERLGSTGLGHGIALPHSRLASVDAPIAAMITLTEGVDFESNDGAPVDVVLGLLVPQDCNDEHLKILANLARRFSDADLRDALRDQESPAALHEHLQQLAPAP